MGYIYAIPSFVVALVHLSISIYLLLIDDNEEKEKAFGMMILWLAFLSFANALELSSTTEDSALVWAYLSALSSFLFASAYIYFVLLFPIKSFKWVDTNKGRLLVMVPTIFFTSLLLVPDLYIAGVRGSRYGYHTEYGAGYNIFMLWGSIVLIGAIVLLWQKYGRVSRIERKQIGLLVLGLLFSTIFYQIFRIPKVDWGVDVSEPYPPLDIWFTVALTFIVLYSIKKYRLFRIQPGASYLSWKTGEPHNLIRSFGSEGNEILYLTRQNPTIVEGRLKDLRERTRIVWITEGRKEEIPYEHVDTRLEHIRDLLLDYIGRNVDSIVIFDAFEYLATNNGDQFDSTLHLIRILIDEIANTDCTLLVTINPLALDIRQRTIIERSGLVMLE